VKQYYNDTREGDQWVVYDDWHDDDAELRCHPQWVIIGEI
jgi:hypothetical protein